MLAITHKVRLLKQEILSAIGVCRDLSGALQGVTDETDFRNEIGFFARQTPDWRILTDERCRFQDGVRRICTGEVSVDEAIQVLQSTLTELELINKWLQIPTK